MLTLLRPILLSAMLGLVEAMREAETTDHHRPGLRWVMQVLVPNGLDRPQRCWFWGKSALAN